MPVDRLITLAVRVTSGVVIVALLLFAWTTATRLTETDRRGAAAALVRDTLEAAADTTRALLMDAALLGDTLRAVERRAIQAEQKADALDRSLRTERVVRDQLQARIATLTAHVQSDTAISDSADGTRRATFDIRDAPYTVRADVTLPRPPQPGAMRLRVELDTLGLALSVACGEPNEFGVRAATARVIAPVWATVRLNRVEQAPSVCAAAARLASPGLASMLRRAAARLSVSVGYGATRQASGAVVAGPGALVGVRIWP
jgi:hypothetical protein